MIFEDHPSPRKLSDQKNLELVEYFLSELRSLYGIEKSLLDILGRFQHIATEEHFIKLLVRYSNIINKNIERLEQIFLLIDMPISSRNSPLLRRILEESKEAPEEFTPPILDLKISVFTSNCHLSVISIYNQLHIISEKMQILDVALLFKNCITETIVIGKALEDCFKKELINKIAD